MVDTLNDEDKLGAQKAEAEKFAGITKVIVKVDSRGEIDRLFSHSVRGENIGEVRSKAHEAIRGMIRASRRSPVGSRLSLGRFRIIDPEKYPNHHHQTPTHVVNIYGTERKVPFPVSRIEGLNG